RRPLALLRDQQIDLADPRLPPPRPVPVAMRQPPLGRDLAELRANLGADLRLHQLPGDQRDRLPDEILQPTIAHLRNDIGNRHALTIGHRGVSFTSTAVQPTSSAPRWPTLAGPRPTRRSLHHFYRRDLFAKRYVECSTQLLRNQRLQWLRFRSLRTSPVQWRA